MLFCNFCNFCYLFCFVICFFFVFVIFKYYFAHSHARSVFKMCSILLKNISAKFVQHFYYVRRPNYSLSLNVFDSVRIIFYKIWAAVLSILRVSAAGQASLSSNALCRAGWCCLQTGSGRCRSVSRCRAPRCRSDSSACSVIAASASAVCSAPAC